MNISTPLPGEVMVVDVTPDIANCILPDVTYAFLTPIDNFPTNLQALKAQRYKLSTNNQPYQLFINHHYY
jgi:hypothetical protein